MLVSLNPETVHQNVLTYLQLLLRQLIVDIIHTDLAASRVAETRLVTVHENKTLHGILPYPEYSFEFRLLGADRRLPTNNC